MKALDNITAVLLIIGGLNWGLVGAATSIWSRLFLER